MNHSNLSHSDLQRRITELEVENERLNLSLNDINSKKESWSSLQNLFDNISEGIYTTSLDGQITSVNQAMVTIFGYSKDEFIGMPAWILAKEDLRPIVKERFMQKVEERNNAFSVVECQKKNGSVITCEINVAHIEKEKYNYGIVRDITEQKKIYKLLEKKNKQLEESQRIAHIGNWELDFEKNELIWSDEIYKIFEIEPDNFGASYEAFLNIVHPDDREIVNNAFINSVKLKQPYSLIHRIKLNDGREKYVVECCETYYDSNDKPVRSVGTVQDITKLHKIEQQLQLYADIIENMQSGLYVYKLEKDNDDSSFKLINANPASTTLLGLEKEYVLGRYIDDIFPNLRKQNIPQKFLNVLNTKIPFETEEFLYSDSNLHDLWFSFKVYPLPNNCICILFDNITERKKQEELIRNKDLKYKQLFENITVGFALHELIFNENGIPVDYKYLEANPAFEKLTGLSINNIVGKTVKELIPNVENYWIETYATVAQTGKSISYRNFVNELGKYFDTWVFSPCKNQFAVIFSDITDRVIANEQLRISEEKFSKAFMVSPSPKTITSISSGKYIDVNQAFLEVTGYSREEVIGKTSLDINIWLSKADRDHIIEQVLKNQRLNDKEICFRMKSGEIRYFLVSTEIIEINNEQCLLLICPDITEKRKAEEALKISEQKLRQQNEEYISLNEELSERNRRIQEMNDELVQAKEKAEESDRLKSAFLSNMSHEIRTPMNAILGFAQLLDSPNISDEKRKKFVYLINKRGYDLLNIINDILDISKIEANQLSISKTQGEVNQLLDEIYHMFASQSEFEIGKQISLKMGKKLQPEYSAIITDFNRIKQIFINLISNAYKFTEKGTIEFGCYLNNRELLFYVKDTGIGIPKDKLKIIFDRFRQAEETFNSRKYGGTGLGLSISKGLIELLGGTIWVESKEKEGSDFYFSIPYLPANEKINKETVVLAQHFSWPDKLILIIEDDSYNTEFLVEMLNETQIRYLIAQNGIAALDIISRNAAFDLVLMDIRLPDINGYEVTRLIKQINHKIPVIAQTAYATDDDRKRCFEAGCDDFIQKPLNKIKLLQLMDFYLKNKK